MKSTRHDQQQIWADREFVDWIMRLKGKFESQGVRIENIGEVTRRLIKVPTITELERQVLQSQNLGELKIKMDARRFLS